MIEMTPQDHAGIPGTTRHGDTDTLKTVMRVRIIQGRRQPIACHVVFKSVSFP